MNLAVKKIELIEWLARLEDEQTINKIEDLKRTSIGKSLEERTPKSEKELRYKLEKSEDDIKYGRVSAHEKVEEYFKSRFNR